MRRQRSPHRGQLLEVQAAPASDISARPDTRRPLARVNAAWEQLLTPPRQEKLLSQPVTRKGGAHGSSPSADEDLTGARAHADRSWNWWPRDQNGRRPAIRHFGSLVVFLRTEEVKSRAAMPEKLWTDEAVRAAIGRRCLSAFQPPHAPPAGGHHPHAGRDLRPHHRRCPAAPCRGLRFRRRCCRAARCDGCTRGRSPARPRRAHRTYLHYPTTRRGIRYPVSGDRRAAPRRRRPRRLLVCEFRFFPQAGTLAGSPAASILKRSLWTGPLIERSGGGSPAGVEEGEFSGCR